MWAYNIEPAQQADLTAILKLLSASGLPQQGLSDHLGTAVVARAGQQVVGCAALELYGSAALLRSVAVTSANRGRGVGQHLTLAAVALARTRGVTHVYLLTETAPQFFPKFGFRPVERAQVPLAVQSSPEFTSLCPASALAMELRLEAPGRWAHFRHDDPGCAGLG